jgi:hypothetical protein
MTHQALQTLHQVEAGQLSYHGVVFLPGQKVAFNTIRALKISPDAVGYGLYFGLFVENNGACCVEGNGVPDKSERLNSANRLSPSTELK